MSPVEVNIVVCIKAVPSQVKDPVLVNNGLNLYIETPSMVINESDEHALEQALTIKRKLGATVTVITVGSVKSQDILQRAMAKGADQAVRVDGDEFDANITALKLARAISKLSFDLILTGVESSDGMSSQVAILVAAHLQIPFAYAVTRIDPLQRVTVRIDRELGGGRFQTLEMAMPALLAVQSGSGELTYPAAAKLVQARRRPIPCWSLADLGLSEDDLAAQRKLRIVGIRPREADHQIDWLTGSAAEIAERILSRIDEAL